MSYNKNLKLYIQNSNKTSSQEFYHRSTDLYSNEIDKINKKISRGVPIKNIINEIKYIIRKFTVLKTVAKSNTVSKAIVNSNTLSKDIVNLNIVSKAMVISNTLSSLENLENVLTYKTELETVKILFTDSNNTLTEINQNLEITLKNLADCKRLCNNNQKSGFKINDVSLNVNTIFKKEYIIYIKDYGVPLNGIFLEPILKYIRDVNNL